MSKRKFTLYFLLGIVVGMIVIRVLQWIGVDISLAHVWNAVFGEPNGVSITIVSLITILVFYVFIRWLYKKSRN